jgi:hypothetical protein
MNRRGILALLGGAAAMPTVGLKSAASALGMETALVAGSSGEMVVPAPPSSEGWWGSGLQMAFDAKERAECAMRENRVYPHMKSWGHGFRQMAAERDAMIMIAYRQKMQDDQSFREKVLAAFGGL